MSDLGQLYVIEFSNGMVKAGRSINVAGRQRVHVREAARFGIYLARSWYSPVHMNCIQTEADLIGWMAGQPSAARVSGREYFVNLDFDKVVARAEALRFDTAPHSETPPLSAALMAVSTTDRHAHAPIGADRLSRQPCRTPDCDDDAHEIQTCEAPSGRRAQRERRLVAALNQILGPARRSA